MKDIMPSLFIGYLCLVVFAVHHTLYYSGTYKQVSHCCEYNYSVISKGNDHKSWCLNCKKWCEVIEIKEKK